MPTLDELGHRGRLDKEILPTEMQMINSISPILALLLPSVGSDREPRAFLSST